MRKVVIESWCDECAAENIENRGEPIDITWRNREVALDLCEKHTEPFREVERLIETYGHQRKRTTQPRVQPTTTAPSGRSKVLPTVNAKGEKTWVCPTCGFIAKNAQGLGAHRRTRHEL
jgi:rubrerythrin